MAPLEIRAFPGAGGGVDLASPSHMLADSKARWIVDGLVDRPGLVRQRGKLKGTEIDGGEKPWGLMSTYRPDGVLILAAHLAADPTVSASFKFLSADNVSQGSFFYGPFGDPTPPAFFQAGPTISKPGQIFFATQSLGWADEDTIMGLWRGGSSNTYVTGTITATQGSPNITGVGTTWNTNITPGMFLFIDQGAGQFTLLGVVKIVTSNTTLTLEEGSLFAGAGKNYKATSIRALRPRIGVGRISGASGQAVVNGTGTKFRRIGTGSTWAMFRQRDMAFLGNVSTITSDTQLTLAANIPANNEVNNDKYVAIKINDTDEIMNPTHGLGMLSTNWQGRQFYANFTSNASGDKYASRLWYSDIDDYEVVDLTTDGWSLDVPSLEGANEPILALCPSENGLLIFKESDVHILTGTADPTTWTLRRLTDNGCISPMSVSFYKGGVIWASDRGIFHYDGTTVNNLTEDSLGDWWTKSLTKLKVGIPGYNMVGFHERDHYFLYSEYSEIPGTASYYKGAVEQSFADGLGIVINIPTGALVFTTNLAFRGTTYVPPKGTQRGTTRFVVENFTTGGSYICEAWTIFIDEGSSSFTGGIDDFASVNGDLGPSFYFESARYDMDNPQIKKLWKQVQVHYRSDSNLTVDIVQNFDVAGTTLGSTFPASTSFVNKRIKFLKRSHLLGFRIYYADPGGGPSAAPLEVQLGPWAIGFKQQRPGRV